MNGKRAAAHHETHVRSSPARVLDALLHRLDQDLEDGRRAIAAGDVAVRHEALEHALRIVVELELALDHGSAPDLWANLSSLYTVQRWIVDSAARNDPEPLTAARIVIGQIQSAFAQGRGCPAETANDRHLVLLERVTEAT